MKKYLIQETVIYIYPYNKYPDEIRYYGVGRDRKPSSNKENCEPYSTLPKALKKYEEISKIPHSNYKTICKIICVDI